MRTKFFNEYKGTRRNLPIFDDACDLTDEEIRELRELLARAYEQLLLLGYDSGFTNEEIHNLIDDITKYLEGTT